MRDAADGRGPVSFVVLSDHGFVPVDKEAAPLVVLGEEGLFVEVNKGSWELRRLGAVHAGGSFALYWLEKPSAEDRRALDRALQRLTETGAVAEIVGRRRLESLAAAPDAGERRYAGRLEIGAIVFRKNPDGSRPGELE